ncbi:MAG TPA: class I SAM-dependent methyltransferase [Stellaceae bacterium]|nr:class I SAM-dependent methyltransferase [Stellaceae bacterium]
MGARSLLPDDIERYVGETIGKETPLQKRLRAETAKLPGNWAMMQIGPDQGAFLALLVRLIGARRTVEIGTFTGYSALAVAQALPPDGKVIACDVNEEWTAIARRYWREAGLADKIELRLGPAAETLRSLLAAGGAGSLDFAFIDADKSGYDTYYELCLELIRPNGLIAVDNVLWSGAVVNAKKRDADTDALRALNLKIRDDGRVDSVLLTVGDGLTLARKRG